MNMLERKQNAREEKNKHKTSASNNKVVITMDLECSAVPKN